MGKKKKRTQEANTAPLSLSSSSLRSTSMRHDSLSPANSTAANHVQTASVGCMSGIFHIMSKYHTRRKFLTSGKKQERNSTIVQAQSPAPEKKNPPPKPEPTITSQPRDHNTSTGRFSLDQAPRSPALPPEIRRSSTDSLVSSPRVVARLMGLEDFPATPPAPVTVALPAVEKRRKLLGALEKCDEDLKALKKIIEAVRATQTPPRVVEKDRREEVEPEAEAAEAEERESEVGSDEPSPVSVLDHRHLSSRYSKRSPNNEQIGQQQQQHKPKQQKPQQLVRKRPGDHEDKAINFIMNNKPSFSVVLTTIPQPLHLVTNRSHQFLNHSPATTYAPLTPWSRAMKESVIEVCKDVEWGQKQEIGRIGLILQDCIFRELIDDIIKDMGSSFHGYSTCKLPIEASKRKLSF